MGLQTTTDGQLEYVNVAARLLRTEDQQQHSCTVVQITGDLGLRTRLVILVAPERYGEQSGPRVTHCDAAVVCCHTFPPPGVSAPSQTPKPMRVSPLWEETAQQLSSACTGCDLHCSSQGRN